MKQSEMIVLGLAGLAVYMIVSKKGGGLTSLFSPALRAPSATTTEIFDAQNTTFDNGWRYYSDGTAIDPQGRYYFQGQLVYTP